MALVPIRFLRPEPDPFNFIALCCTRIPVVANTAAAFAASTTTAASATTSVTAVTTAAATAAAAQTGCSGRDLLRENAHRV